MEHLVSTALYRRKRRSVLVRCDCEGPKSLFYFNRGCPHVVNSTNLREVGGAHHQVPCSVIIELGNEARTHLKVSSHFDGKRNFSGQCPVHSRPFRKIDLTRGQFVQPVADIEEVRTQFAFSGQCGMYSPSAVSIRVKGESSVEIFEPYKRAIDVTSICQGKECVCLLSDKKTMYRRSKKCDQHSGPSSNCRPSVPIHLAPFTQRPAPDEGPPHEIFHPRPLLLEPILS